MKQVTTETATANQATPKRAFSIIEAGQYLSIGRGLVYKLAKSGDLPIRKIGDRSIILKEDLDAFLNALPAVEA